MAFDVSLQNLDCLTSQDPMQSFLSALQFAVATAAVAFWALGMYCWWLLDHANQPSRAQRRTRVVKAFAVMAALGAIAYFLRVSTEASL